MQMPTKARLSFIRVTENFNLPVLRLFFVLLFLLKNKSILL